MDEFKKFKNLALLFLLTIFTVFLCIRVKTTHNPGDNHGDTITVTVTVFDTTPYYKPVPKDSLVIKYITKKLPNVTDREDNFLITDSSDVVIPITQQVYTDDSTYTAYISGYNTTLDSMLIYHRLQQTFVQVPSHPPPQKTSRWSVSVHVGYGMTMSSTPQFTPYIGVGLSYKLFNF
ncbi:MAG: hypothetical protein IKM23_05740 [Bacteroidales bacterium]|nr:hypothetical protein [Bacteroidales bacterium]